jgi:hypothetical protein
MVLLVPLLQLLQFLQQVLVHHWILESLQNQVYQKVQCHLLVLQDQENPNRQLNQVILEAQLDLAILQDQGLPLAQQILLGLQVLEVQAAQ